MANGYRLRAPQDYDRRTALDRGVLCEFLRTTQPVAWAALEKAYGAQAEESLVRQVVQSLEALGTLATLRGEIRMVPDIRFRLCEFRPASGLTPVIEKRYQGNILSVIRQLRYSLKNENALDLGLFVNGIPVATAELKNELTGSSVKTAEAQYRHDRPPAGEPLLTFQRGALVHFAVDERLVSMTTLLANGNTEFLPFNRGRDGGKGNPDPEPGKFATSYLWEQVWQKDSWLDILHRFIHLQVKKEEGPDGKEREKRRLIFPRWHQLEAVRMLVAHARDHGAGQNYLVQHSAGSGKSNTIAWSAHRLATLWRPCPGLGWTGRGSTSSGAPT